MNLKNINKKLIEWNANEEESSAFLDLYIENKDRLAKYNVNVIQAKSLKEAKNNIIAIQKVSKKQKLIKEIIPEHELFDEKMIEMILFVYDKEIENDKQELKKKLLTIKNNAQSKEDLEKLILNNYLAKKDNQNKIGNDQDVVFEDQEYRIIKPKNYNDFMNLNPPESWCISSNIKEYQRYESHYGKFYFVIKKMDKYPENICGVNMSLNRMEGFSYRNYGLKKTFLDEIKRKIQEDIIKEDNKNKKEIEEKKKLKMDKFLNNYNKYIQDKIEKKSESN